MPFALPKSCFAILAFVCLLFAWPQTANAETTLVSSDPASGAILPVPPAEIRLAFGAALDPATTSATLIDRFGDEVPGATIRIDNETEIVITPPFGLVDGAYSVRYWTGSPDDSNGVRGLLPFAIGSSADLRLVSDSATSGSAAGWSNTIGRWMALTGTLGAMSLWSIWSYVVEPAFRRRTRSTRRALDSLRMFAIAAFLIAVAGSLLEIIARARNLDEPIVDALQTTLFDTRYGDFWIARMLLLGVLASLLSLVDWVHPRRNRLVATLTTLVSLALPIPFSFVANAADEVTGRTFAIVSDYLHTTAAGLWGGGVVVIAISLFGSRAERSETPESIREFAPRYAFVSIASWIVLAITGGYAAWLQIGSLDVARATDYGNAFLVKMALTAVLLAFLASSCSTAIRRHDAVSTRRQRGMFATQSILIVLVLLATSWMMSQPPARDSYIDSTSGHRIALSDHGLSAQLWLSPAAAGPNHYQLSLDGFAPPGSVATLHMTPPEEGVAPIEVALTPVGPNNWENHGAEFSLVGTWSIDATISDGGAFDWRASTNVTIVSSADPLPGQPWRFGLNALVGLAMLVVGAIALGRVIGIPGGRSRKETAGIGIAGLAIGAVFLLSARLEAPPAFVLADDDTLARGSAVWAQQCLACHGVTGEGDGPEAPSLPAPPADFTDPIHQLHSDSSLAIMIQNGFPLSGMPAFADVLTAGEIADVISYIRALGAGASAVETPAAADCTIDPRDIETLISITSAGPARTNTVAAWPIGVEATGEESAAVGATIRQFVACSNAGDYERVLATESLGYLAPQFAGLDEAGPHAAEHRSRRAVRRADAARLDPGRRPVRADRSGRQPVARPR